MNNTKLYLSPILDLYNGEIVSYTLYDRPTYKMVEEMIELALKRPMKKKELTIHSNQGWHYQMRQYQILLKSKNVKQSMSRKGNCLDNAAMESFFGILKSEFFYRQEFLNTTDFRKQLEEYIHWYNHNRIKMKLNGLSPVQYRKQSA